MPAAVRKTHNPRSTSAHHMAMARYRPPVPVGIRAASYIGYGPARRLRQEAAPVSLALHHVWRSNAHMPDTGIDFSAPATLRKWPSLNKQRVSASPGARPYMISEGTLDECIHRFMQLRETQRHLYEIHTAQQSDLVGAILSTDHIVELARLRDFLGK
jgi:hypothetical protein